MPLVNVSLADDASDELFSLFDWLQRDDEFRGKVKTQSRRSGPHEMGGAVELLTVALGSGGLGAILAGSVAAWLQTRRTRICVEVVAGDSGEVIRKVEVDSGSPAVTERILRDVLIGGEGVR